ncbi:hypothetical protein HDC92_000611 [Pedobacter sp. AK017]|uniref:hypothetical protein n=1 Tax=Pedobacter sp. AK017 TaxID=2723073 RepID=UPI00162065EB|nr:hypothetical protein [Pedobacter sp. AK017]MBB5436947.1 hypothetical protein [Pedobacter sp. AK017]
MYKRKLNGKWAGMRRVKHQDAVATKHLLDFLGNLYPVTEIFNEKIKPMLSAYAAGKRFEFAKPGNVVKTALWIEWGYVRFYRKLVNEKGIKVEETIKFGIPQSIVLVPTCFFNDNKCTYYIDIAKYTVVIPFTRDHFDELKQHAPETEALANAILSLESPAEFERGAMMRLNGAPRYELFMDIYGEEINQFFKQKQIASFLSISPEYLSKLRAGRNKRRAED